MGAHVWKRDAGSYTVGVTKPSAQIGAGPSSSKRQATSEGDPPANSNGSAAADVQASSSVPPAKRARVGTEAAKQPAGLFHPIIKSSAQTGQQQLQAPNNAPRGTGAPSISGISQAHGGHPSAAATAAAPKPGAQAPQLGPSSHQATNPTSSVPQEARTKGLRPGAPPLQPSQQPRPTPAGAGSHTSISPRRQQLRPHPRQPHPQHHQQQQQQKPQQKADLEAALKAKEEHIAALRAQLQQQEAAVKAAAEAAAREAAEAAERQALLKQREQLAARKSRLNRAFGAAFATAAQARQEQEKTAAAAAAAAAPVQVDAATAPATEQEVKQVLSGKSDYEVFQLKKGCGRDDLKRRYKELARKLHPDKCQVPNATAAFQRVQQAYQKLMSEVH